MYFSRQITKLFFLLVLLIEASASGKVRPLKGYFERRVQLSPDRKYLVDSSGEGHNTGKLIVYKMMRDKDNIVRKIVVLKKSVALDYSANGFAWVPKHPASFVIAHRLPGGQAFIGFWRTNDRFRVLRAGKLGPHDDPDLFVYILDGISSSGKMLYYHDANGRKHSLKLPI